MPLLRNCNGVRDSNNASKMPWVTELTIDSSRKCRATAVNDQWLITAATCCTNTESITMPSGASASAIHMNGFYGDLSDGTGRNFDFCLVKFQNHGLSIPCRKGFYIFNLFACNLPEYNLKSSIKDHQRPELERPAGRTLKMVHHCHSTIWAVRTAKKNLRSLSHLPSFATATPI